MSEELKKLLQQVHEGITIFDFDGKPIPCIIFEEKKYDELLSKVAGRPLSINTDLNILQDGMGHVFVEIVLTFSQDEIEEKILINANKDIIFFFFKNNAWDRFTIKIKNSNTLMNLL